MLSRALGGLCQQPLASGVPASASITYREAGKHSGQENLITQPLKCQRRAPLQRQTRSIEALPLHFAEPQGGRGKARPPPEQSTL
eukprot:8206348-Alexandrium_andersonii.AAC.1